MQLTDEDRRLLRWLVEEIKKRRLGPEFIVLWTATGAVLPTHKGPRSAMPETLTKERFTRFLEADLIVQRTLPHGGWQCVLRKNAYCTVM